jgi:hypothetical protein
MRAIRWRAVSDSFVRGSGNTARKQKFRQGMEGSVTTARVGNLHHKVKVVGGAVHEDVQLTWLDNQYILGFQRQVFPPTTARLAAETTGSRKQLFYVTLRPAHVYLMNSTSGYPGNQKEDERREARRVQKR